MPVRHIAQGAPGVRTMSSSGDPSAISEFLPGRGRYSHLRLCEASTAANRGLRRGPALSACCTPGIVASSRARRACPAPTLPPSGPSADDCGIHTPPLTLSLRILTRPYLWPNIGIVVLRRHPSSRSRQGGRDSDMVMVEEETTSGPPQSSSPARRKARRPARRGQVRVFGHWCKGCGLCIAYCPRDVFVSGADGRPLPVYAERCTACMWCVEHCPDFAIVVQPIDGDPPQGDAA